MQSKDKLEIVQRKADVFSMIDQYAQSLKMEPLEHRRTKFTVIMFYKLMNNIVTVNFFQIIFIEVTQG